MNVYDFDKTIYYGDSTADFYLFCLKRHKKILTLAPSLLGAFLKFYVFKKGTKTDFKEKMYRFLKTADKKWVSAILSLEANRPEQKRRGMCEKGNLYFTEQCLAYGNGACVWK